MCGHKCYVTMDRRALSTADAVIFFPFYMRNFSAIYPTRTNPDQYFVFWEHETPVRYPEKNVTFPKNYFNATATYSLSADIPIPYGTYEPIARNMTKEEYYEHLLEEIGRKTRGVYAVYSHCETESGREHVIRNLQKYINVDVYGQCRGGIACDRECYNRNKENYRFYLSFENSVCNDYASEKFFNFNTLIPIVLKREYYKRHPQHSFIAVDDFGSLKELADYLNLLSMDDKKYAEYLTWTYDKRRKPRGRHIMLCDVCDYVSKRPARKIYSDIDDFVDLGRSCDLNFKRDVIEGRILQ
ncbi:unnamed protein product [Bursaphelenchus xylophilus]|uniref:Fucosyltransferase n=1 Tax=Bursaphelenchus xylophilus TaxID=6326 RepID=A0A1I7RQD6_BURXY|nr:unnamed protein product [Bursaphelenchus xylophilus]CAG9104409.1 unnamed protein product [Bursaphelenchus xylophilus]